MYVTYVALLHRNKASDDYGVIFPDFPGAVFAGETMETAMEKAREGLIFHIEGMQESSEVIPEPTDLASIVSAPEWSDGIPALIRVILPAGKLKRLNITMDSELLKEIDHTAQALGQNRSQFLASAAKRMIA